MCAIDRKLSNELKRNGMIDTFAKKFNLPRPTLCVTRSVLIDRVLVMGKVVLVEGLIFP